MSNFLDPMDCSTADFPVLHHLSELAQTNVHWVYDAIQPISSSVIPFSSYLPSFPASGSFLMSQLFATVQFSSVTQSCLTFCNSMTAAHQASCPSLTHGVYSNSCPLSHDAIQPSHPLHLLLLWPSIFPSTRVSSNESILWPKVSEFHLQHQSFQWVFSTDFL